MIIQMCNITNSVQAYNTFQYMEQLREQEHALHSRKYTKSTQRTAKRVTKVSI